MAFLFAAQVTHGNQIGEELFQERKHPKQGRHDENAAITILNIGQMDDGMKQQAQRIRNGGEDRFGSIALILPYLGYVRYPAHPGPANWTLRTSG